MKVYRKIWEEVFGKIPVDEDGRTYEIHHIDGNRNNNTLSNLICVTIEEHLKIHQEQEDWGACNAIVRRMKLTKEDVSALNSHYSKLAWRNPEYRNKQNKRREEMWKNPEYVSKLRAAGLQNTLERVKNKTHQFFNPEVRKNNTESRLKTFAKLAEEGKHNFQSAEAKQLSSKMANERNSVKYVCPHCSKEGVGPVMKRHHFNNCKLLAVDSANRQKELENGFGRS